MRVSIDWAVCCGAGMCADAAPRAFRVIDAGDGRRRAVVSGPAADDVLCEAAYACPTLAIRLIDDDGRAVYPPAPPATGGR